MELFTFDKAYVDRLRDGDPQTEQHFVAYFGQILGIMLRARMLSPERVEDLRQETFSRVIAVLRRDGGIKQPERFGAFVNSVCKNVYFESNRENFRSQPLMDSHLESPDKIVDLETSLITEETKERVREILGAMSPKDRDLLRAIFLEEGDKDEVCRRFGVDRDYLRVRLHRAKERFKEVYMKGCGAGPTEISKRSR
ncbi:MAG TPA: sigma-70 family RNA polymerase sigma factor [Candidatus Acidoferrum sp.]|nr:sigma-70 family RNA polymerase sigma factor [Candidatus Acidoferrum sp.]